MKYVTFRASQHRRGAFAFLRKGEVGGWRSYFTPELNERFAKEVLSKLKGTGLEFDFEKKRGNPLKQ